MNTQRSNSFLNLIRKSHRGKLRIYLGYCAGVGKTYQMLQEAQRLSREGIDVVIGYVETHGRTNTEALLAGLEVIPRCHYYYKNIEIEEMDLESILSRKPQVVLVDELAHTNLPGSRNSKRYLDIEEIRANGIHVISTMNVQHLESLYDTVESSTKVRVRERVPDRILADADEVINVDISVEDLIGRLKNGYIYVKDGVENALSGFFNTPNLEQLREMTMREIAAQIDFKRRDLLDDNATISPDQVMVCLSSKGLNRDKLLRYASRLAGRLNRNWYAVYVQTPHENPDRIDLDTQKILNDTLLLAKQLGATVFTYKGEDIVGTIIQFAKEYRVGHIVIGTSGKKKRMIDRIFNRKGIVERIIEESHGTNIVIVDTRSNNPVNTEFLINTPEKEIKKESVFEIQHPLKSSNLLIWNNIVERNQAINDLVTECCKGVSAISDTAVLEKVMHREQQGATYLSEEIGFPHCRIENIQTPLLMIGIAKAGIHDHTTGNTSKFMILLLSPLANPQLHIKMIGKIARFVSDTVLLRQLFESDNAEEARKRLVTWDT